MDKDRLKGVIQKAILSELSSVLPQTNINSGVTQNVLAVNITHRVVTALADLEVLISEAAAACGGERELASSSPKAVIKIKKLKNLSIEQLISHDF
jgi:hypothetical protein|tara:strand:- start:262 stop:549 length:288 start_codon:yes stop_codon:yes gene_type:complete